MQILRQSKLKAHEHVLANFCKHAYYRVVWERYLYVHNSLGVPTQILMACDMGLATAGADAVSGEAASRIIRLV